MNGIRKMQQIAKTSYTISSIKVVDLFWRNIFLPELRLRMAVVRQGLMWMFMRMFARPRLMRTRFMRTSFAFFL